MDSFLDLFKVKAHWPGEGAGCLSDFGSYNNNSNDAIDVLWESVKENKGNSNTVQLFPNPANNRVTIQSKEKIVSVCLYNHIGQKVFEQTGRKKHQLLVATTTIKSGVYLIAIETESGIATKKLIVSHLF